MSATVVAPAPSSVTTQLKYMVPPNEGVRAYQKTDADPITGVRERNYEQEDREVVIENVRGKEDTVSLDTTGFQFFKHTSKVKSFTTDEEIVNEYYPESIELIKKLTGATRVVLFDHTVRRRRPGQVVDTPFARQPVSGVHVDQSPKAAYARVHRHLPAADAPKLVQGRFQIINLWRPIENPVLDWPLALCDYRSVNPEDDVVPVDLVYPDRKGETLGVKYSKDHKFKYLHGMTPDEIVLIKCSDSLQDGSVAVFTPHTAFFDPTTPEGAPFRQSIELRSLVFYD